MRNYLRLGDAFLGRVNYMFVDTKDHISDRLLNENKISVRDAREFFKEGSPYRLIVCKIKKKDEEAFKDCIAGIANRAILLGYRDYELMCDELMAAAV